MRSFLACLLLCATSFPLDAGEQPPEIVLFLSDDHGALDTSITGDPLAPTPHLEDLPRWHDADARLCRLAVVCPQSGGLAYWPDADA